jgi:tripartite-type tricarboxylate transporter receptor subunit TctC
MLRRLFLSLGFLAFAVTAHGQNFPNKPVRIIVPFPPGGGTDVVARAVAPKMSQVLGVPVVVQNHPGAGSSLGTELAARSPADGYTLLLVSSATAINNAFDKTISWDVQRDFQPVALLLFNQSLLVAHPSVPFSTVPELLAFVKSTPNKLAYASSGAGSSAHFGMELFKSMAGIDVLHVPYKGAAPAMNDLLGGQVQLMLSDISVVLPHVRAGKVKVLGIGSPKRFAATPDVPTISETGVPGFEVSGLIGLAAPAGTPASVVARLNEAANEAVKDPKIREQLVSMAMIIEGGAPERLGQVLQTDLRKWGDLIKKANLQKE